MDDPRIAYERRLKELGDEFDDADNLRRLQILDEIGRLNSAIVELNQKLPPRVSRFE